MPYKFNDARRDKIPKAKCRVTNWSAYNESLRRRGDLTVWVANDVAQNWAAPHRKSRGGQARYSDLAIEICLTLRVVFRLALRQTQGFMRSIAQLMNLDLPVPDFSTLSRRSTGLKIQHRPRRSDGPITLIVDSTGLKMHGGNGWNAEKHGTTRPRKTWRKLHLAFNPDTGDIVGSELTTEHVGDETALPDLVGEIDADVDRFVADGAYDGEGVSAYLTARFGCEIEIIVPPPKNAVNGDNSQRNRHIDQIAEHGRMNWQREKGYNQRSQIEAQIGRWKTIIGGSLQARKLDNQITETRVAAKAMNRMTALGKAQFERVI
jgi:hypothetical protein